MPGSLSSNLHPFDPEHLIVNGLGGAFLHPTHVFAPARFASVPDPAADDLFEAGLSPRGRSPKGASPSGASPRGRSPSGASPRRTLSRRGSFIGALHFQCLLQSRVSDSVAQPVPYNVSRRTVAHMRHMYQLLAISIGYMKDMREMNRLLSPPSFLDMRQLFLGSLQQLPLAASRFPVRLWTDA